MKRTIFVVVAIIVVIGAYYVYKMQKATPVTKQTEQTEQQVAPVVIGESQSFTVTYTDSGFSPVPLTIKLGDNVNFKNESSAPMWVASAPHPAHTDYPEFDAKKGAGEGETYSFTFTKVGTWKYHDHLNPTRYGSIIVE